MQWTLRVAHLLLQTSTRVLNEDLDDLFRRWYPTVIGGMLASTLIAIFLIPVAFYLVEKVSHRKSDKSEAPPVETPQLVGAMN